MYIKTLLYFFIFVLFYSCKNENNNPRLKEGIWRATLTLDTLRGIQLPFNFEVKHKDTGYVFTIINGEEKIICEEIYTRKKSIVFQPPVFDSQVIGDFSEEWIDAIWINYSRREKNIIDFYAEHNKPYRFKENPSSKKNISGRWKVMFDENGEQTPAIGVFTQKNSLLYGTFLTETGDYRYLEGCVDEDTLFLSAFDGAHAFLFRAIINNENKMQGEFWSGVHHYEKWYAEKNDSFQLPSADTLTHLNPGQNKISFSFPSVDGDTISLSDKKFENKVVIVQVMGSWCPNCKDETEWLTQVHKKYNQQGLEIIALAFERSRDKSTAVKNIKKLKAYYNCEYDFLLAGSSDKKEAGQKLSMLNHIMSFPTTIFIDKKGVVRKIHTGFSGPGTGDDYTQFVSQTDSLIAGLIREQ